MVKSSDIQNCISDYTVYGTREKAHVKEELDMINRQQNPRLVSLRAFHEYMNIAGYVDKELFLNTISLN